MRVQTRTAVLAALMITLGGGMTPLFGMLQPTGAEAGGDTAAGTAAGVPGAQPAAAAPAGGLQDDDTAEDQDELADAKAGGAGAGAGAGTDAKAAATRRENKDRLRQIYKWCLDHIDEHHRYDGKELAIMGELHGVSKEQMRAIVIRFKQRLRGPQ